MRWDDNLDGIAKHIAEEPSSMLRVVAGPGTGKTFALMRRVARLIQEANVPPWRILVCTFTRTAASDLQRELTLLGVDGVAQVRCGTLHSLCFSILRKSEVLAITKRFPRPLLQFEERFLQEDLKGAYGGVRAVATKVRAFNAAWARLQHETPGWPADADDRRFSTDLDGWLRFHHAMLIGEFIPEALHYLRDNPMCPERNEFDYVLVDEYQDLNRAEQSILELLSSNSALTIIGDEDQSIYSFKFAHPDGIANFEEEHPGTHSESLDCCRRCPSQIVEMANCLISNNSSRVSRALNPLETSPRGDVYIVQWSNMNQEAEGIAEFIDNRINSIGTEPGQILILAPRRDFGYAIRNSINARGIPAHSFFSEEAFDGSSAIMEESQSQQAFTLLTLLAEPDDRVALRCWCGFGKGGLATKGWSRLWDHCEEANISPRQALSSMSESNFKLPYTDYLVSRYTELTKLESEMQNLIGMSLLDALFPMDEVWAQTFRSFASVIMEPDFDASVLLDTLRSSLTQPELPTDVDYVRVMSLHKSKGLTADVVVVAGCVEGLIPSNPKDLNTSTEKSEYRQEQRRLLYVAITRARKILLLSSITSLPIDLAFKMGVTPRAINGRIMRTITSRFINELGPTRPDPIRGSDFLMQLQDTIQQHEESQV